MVSCCCFLIRIIIVEFSVTADDKYAHVIGSRKEEIDKARAQVAAKNALLELAKTQFSDTHLYTPSAGTILTRVLEPGAIAAVGQTIVSLAIADPAWVCVYISEQRLGYIAPGMPAEVISDSRPDQPYRGHIGFISPQAEFTPKNVANEELRTRLVTVMAYLLFIVALISMLLCHYIAKKRGLHPTRWVIIAAIIGPLAILLLLLIKPKSK